MPKSEITITEIEEFEPERVDGVGKGANGFPILMLKSLEAEPAEITSEVDALKAGRKDCPTCDGTGKIMDGHRDCPDCKGFSKAPKVGETKAEYDEAVKAGTAPSSANDPYPTGECPTCNGHGAIADGTVDGKPCPDCGGTGLDQNMVNPAELRAVQADAGSISIGDPYGRERIDKATDECPGCVTAAKSGMATCPDCGAKVSDEVEKAGESEALVALHDKAHEDWHRSIGQEPCTSKADCEKKQAEYAASEGKKAVVIAADGTMASGPNPIDGMMADNDMDADNGYDATIPGSPAWEAIDAATATAAAQALMQAADLISKFAQREAQEVAAGEGNDVFDVTAANQALTGVSAALGIMAQMAFHEGLEAQKSIGDVEKTVSAIAIARDHLSTLLSSGDQAMVVSSVNDSNSIDDEQIVKSAEDAHLAKEIEDMTTDELQKVLDARDERLVALLADAIKGDDDEVVPAIDDEAVKGDKKDDDDDEMSEDTDDDEKSEDKGMTKADDDALTPDQIEAKRLAKEAKKALKAARLAEKDAAEAAAMQKQIAEGVTEAAMAVRSLQERLSVVEKMAAPSSIVRTRPQEALIKSVERDELELRLAHLERLSRETPDNDIRKAKREEAAEVRAQIASLNA